MATRLLSVFSVTCLILCVRWGRRYVGTSLKCRLCGRVQLRSVVDYFDTCVHCGASRTWSGKTDPANGNYDCKEFECRMNQCTECDQEIAESETIVWLNGKRKCVDCFVKRGKSHKNEEILVISSGSPCYRSALIRFIKLDILVFPIVIGVAFFTYGLLFSSVVDALRMASVVLSICLCLGVIHTLLAAVVLWIDFNYVAFDGEKLLLARTNGAWYCSPLENWEIELGNMSSATLVPFKLYWRQFEGIIFRLDRSTTQAVGFVSVKDENVWTRALAFDSSLASQRLLFERT